MLPPSDLYFTKLTASAFAMLIVMVLDLIVRVTEGQFSGECSPR